MRFVAYIHREEFGVWPPPESARGGDPIIIEVAPETTFGDGVAEVLASAGEEVMRLYYFPGHAPPVYTPLLLRDSNDPDSELLPFPRVAIGEDGEFIWVWGARDRATFADYERARAAGYTEGDPYGVFLWRPLGGDGIIPTWLELLQWLEEGAVVGAAAWFIAFIRRNVARWEGRGATVPNDFLDLIVTRDEWSRADLAKLLGISDEDAVGISLRLATSHSIQ